MCVCVSEAHRLRACTRHRQICYPVRVSCGQEGRAGCGRGTSLEEEGLEEEGKRKAGGIERWWRSVVVAWDNDSVIGHGEEAHPCATAPPTSNMPYYVDLWRWLDSTFKWVRPGPSKDLSLHKIKGGQGICQTKANSGGQRRSWTERFTLRQPSDRSETKKTTFQALWRLH